ncbi:coniferyl aldehyde dehydrogenase [Hyphococcus luteus]|uniref:Aldehyde dehydrogenase n=1 Tax=Hyphococcus luteus TaxID=2058213 RepID=A0A2S7K1Z9_9PROT|nr:coniferyl aldehyde dehydrogenase [Marinicaulis flavus]PQA86529.1 coniferyl aldehyde dehydrogenase [Marinicaulis flavus]
MAADAAHTPSEGRTDGERELARLFALQKEAYAAAPFPSYEERIANLNRIIRLTEANEDAFIEAINADFGNRARQETVIAEIVVTVSGAKLTKKNLKKWMQPRGAPTPLHMLPARSRIEPQPLGVVGIISPWNYPLQLALAPAIAALAAGNRVLIKPSELTPHLAETLKAAIASEFDESVCAVVTGGVETGQAFTETPFDHLLFTGSTAVGKRVAEAAAKNLTPVTLELGGKSPAIIDESADIETAARSIAHGKMLNAGQTCVAPDYVLAPRDKVDATVDAIAAAARKMFPAIDTTHDYTSIISDRHFARLKSLVEEARDRGAKIVEIGSSNALYPQRKLPLTMIVDPPADAAVMKEEIFGPVLPVLPIGSTDEAIAYVNKGDRPLALYWYGESDAARDKVLEKTVSGGVTVNDALWHVAQENLPFGGVGKSGIGAYHGETGFNTFSHLKPVFYQSRFASSALLHPPYTAKTDKIISFVRKIL